MAVSNTTNLQAFDEIMINLMRDYTQLAVSNSENSVEQILQVSSTYISRSAHTALREFYQLYFGDKKAEASSQKMNDNVSNLFDQIKGMVDAGVEVTADSVYVDEEIETQRLGLSGLQKQMETVISLEEGLKTKLIPIFSSMQFEDAMRQRLEHLDNAWPKLLTEMRNPKGPVYAQVAKDIADSTSSQEESEKFYSLVMHEKAPAALPDRSIWLDFT